MEKLIMMKEELVNYIEYNMKDLASVDSKELGEAIDMVKDLSEAIYYCTIVESMQGDKDKMYYGPKERDWREPMHDYPMNKEHKGKEEQSASTRKVYMERKMYGGDKTILMQELEKYVAELTHELMEMIEGSSMEEKQMLAKKLTTLAGKIA